MIYVFLLFLKGIILVLFRLNFRPKYFSNYFDFSIDNANEFVSSRKRVVLSAIRLIFSSVSLICIFLSLPIFIAGGTGQKSGNLV